MNFDDIRDQLIERFQTIWSRIQDNSTYISLRERYEGLSPNGQKLTLAGLAFLGMLILLYIPYTYYDSSANHVQDFESKRELTRALLRVSRTSHQAPLERVTASQLRTRIDSEVRTFNLQPEQIGQVQELSPETMRNLKLAPAPIQEEGIEIRLTKLNLKQLVDIGHRLQTLSEVVKLSGMSLTANSDDHHYYDVTFQVASFSVPEPAPTANNGAKGKGR